MKNLLTLTVMMAAAGVAFANAPPILIQEHSFGSGLPGSTGATQSTSSLPDGLFYAPQYLPGYPTAAIIWPRVIDVNCTTIPTGEVKCDGYNWVPEYGRGEYLLIRPTIVQPIEPKVIEVVLPQPPRVIKKKKAE